VVVVLVLAGLAVLGAVVVLAMGRGGELAETHPDYPELPLPTARPITGTEAALLKLPRGLWGYQVGFTDEAIHRLAYSLAERESRMAMLEQQLADLRYQLGEPAVTPEGAWTQSGLRLEVDPSLQAALQDDPEPFTPDPGHAYEPGTPHGAADEPQTPEPPASDAPETPPTYDPAPVTREEPGVTPMAPGMGEPPATDDQGSMTREEPGAPATSAAPTAGVTDGAYEPPTSGAPGVGEGPNLAVGSPAPGVPTPEDGVAPGVHGAAEAREAGGPRLAPGAPATGVPPETVVTGGTYESPAGGALGGAPGVGEAPNLAVGSPAPDVPTPESGVAPGARGVAEVHGPGGSPVAPGEPGASEPPAAYGPGPVTREERVEPEAHGAPAPGAPSVAGVADAAHGVGEAGLPPGAHDGGAAPEAGRDWPWGDSVVEAPKGENGRPVPPKEQSFEEDELFEQTLFDDHESNAEERS